MPLHAGSLQWLVNTEPWLCLVCSWGPVQLRDMYKGLAQGQRRRCVLNDVDAPYCIVDSSFCYFSFSAAFSEAAASSEAFVIGSVTFCCTPQMDWLLARAIDLHTFWLWSSVAISMQFQQTLHYAVQHSIQCLRSAWIRAAPTTGDCVHDSHCLYNLAPSHNYRKLRL